MLILGSWPFPEILFSATLGLLVLSMVISAIRWGMTIDIPGGKAVLTTVVAILGYSTMAGAYESSRPVSGSVLFGCLVTLFFLWFSKRDQFGQATRFKAQQEDNLDNDPRENRSDVTATPLDSGTQAFLARARARELLKDPTRMNALVSATVCVLTAGFLAGYLAAPLDCLPEREGDVLAPYRSYDLPPVLIWQRCSSDSPLYDDDYPNYDYEP